MMYFSDIYVWEILITESVPLIIAKICYNYRMSSLAQNNEQRWNEQWYFSLCSTSYLHRLAVTTFYESTFYKFIPCNLLTMLLFFKFIHSIKFRATCMTISFRQHNSGSSQHDFGQDDFRVTWPVTLRTCWNVSKCLRNEETNLTV